MRAFLVRMVLAWRAVKVDDFGDGMSLLKEGTEQAKELSGALKQETDVLLEAKRAKGPSSESEREH